MTGDSTNMVSFSGISTNMVRYMQKKIARLETSEHQRKAVAGKTDERRWM